MGGSGDLLFPLAFGHLTAFAVVTTQGEVDEHDPSGDAGVLRCLETNLDDDTLSLCGQLYEFDTYSLLVSSPSSLYRYIASLSVATVLLLLVSLYMTAAILYSAFAWYRFLAAWNLILQARRFDNIQLRRRRLSSHKLMQSQVHVDTMSKQNLTCPICLVDFFERELVTACDSGGCGNWFHRECLVKWLDRSDSCPCCRKNLLTDQPRQINIADMARSCLGFVTR